jgi:hypothetical protein
MNGKKMSFASIRNMLSKDEMKQVSGGSGTSGVYCSPTGFACNPGTICNHGGNQGRCILYAWGPCCVW